MQRKPLKKQNQNAKKKKNGNPQTWIHWRLLPLYATEILFPFSQLVHLPGLYMLIHNDSWKKEAHAGDYMSPRNVKVFFFLLRAAGG